MAYGRSTTSSILDGFTLSPLPYPVLIILTVISLLLGLHWYSSYESLVEATEQSMGWGLLFIPVLILIVVRWLSSLENPGWFFQSSPFERQRRTHHIASEGSSPWAVAAVILLLLVLVHYQSNFLDSWFP
ncbi:uncharacterized protein LOC130785423 [Actinidia eriantha]|uniref:uncharacterized protein LOC130785423 n=1 Tax=Actinidia eriantha TaxID=165200 RepID=UPI00258AFCA9|nr:uncharacterized protein LOC130785423 [Actinidia eriantha]